MFLCAIFSYVQVWKISGRPSVFLFSVGIEPSSWNLPISIVGDISSMSPVICSI